MSLAKGRASGEELTRAKVQVGSLLEDLRNSQETTSVTGSAEWSGILH